MNSLKGLRTILINRKVIGYAYRGERILKTSYVGSKKFYIETKHCTGIYYDEQNSPQFNSLEAAREWIENH